MTLTRVAALLLIIVFSTLAAGCGGDGGTGDDDSRDAGSESAEEADDSGSEDEGDAAPQTPEEVEERTGGGAFALTPELARCMEQAGFTQDAPPTGALAAWRHPSGARAVVASSEQESVTGGIASEIGAQHEAVIVGDLVIAGDGAPVGDATACLA